ncbi:MAG: EFR1 family ferrodoxin [Candidatus Helarchaeota archaeon]
MRIAIFYHSVTGNTKYAAELIKKGIEESCHECELFYIHHLEFNNNDYEKYDILGFGTPVFAFREMNSIRKFIRNIPNQQKYAFLFCTCNESPGNALYRMAVNLKRCGFIIFDKAVFYFPSSYTIWRKNNQDDIIKRKEIDKMINFGKNISSSYNKIKQGEKPPKISYSLFNTILGKFSSDTNLRFYLGKIHVNTEICTKCGLCKNICPADAIELNPFPIISKKCTGCCGCINLCPVRALDSKKTINKIIYKFDQSLIEK